MCKNNKILNFFDRISLTKLTQFLNNIHLFLIMYDKFIFWYIVHWGSNMLKCTTAILGDVNGFCKLFKNS